MEGRKNSYQSYSNRFVISWKRILRTGSISFDDIPRYIKDQRQKCERARKNVYTHFFRFQLRFLWIDSYFFFFFKES